MPGQAGEKLVNVDKQQVAGASWLALLWPDQSKMNNYVKLY